MLVRKPFVWCLPLVLAIAISLSGSAFADDSRPTLHEYLAKHKATVMGKTRSLIQDGVLKVRSASDNYDVLTYDIFIRVDDTTQIIYGTIGFEAEPTESGVSSIEADLEAGMSIDSIVAPSGPLVYSRLADVVTITLDQAYDPGETFAFDFYYHGHPVSTGLQAFEFSTYDGSPAISTLSSPYFSHTWWPCKDRLNDKAASYKIKIEVDTGLYAVSNGTLDSIVPAADNSHAFYYTEIYPMETYLFSLAIAPYMIWQMEYVSLDESDTMPVIFHAFSDLYAESQTSSWTEIPSVISTFAGVFGEYPYIEHKYGHAHFKWGGGMEHQTCSSIGYDDFGFTIDLIAHELSHQWWGDMISASTWEDIWLKEGWASYSEAIYHLETYGWQDYRDYMETMRYTGGGTVWCDDTTDVYRIFDSHLTYDKAAWVVHMLRGVVGEAAWLQGVHDYYNSEYQYGTLNTAEFCDLWEASTGEELSWFFDEWIYGEYYPQFQYEYYEEPSDSGGYDLYLFCQQVQSTDPVTFHMPVDFFLNRGGMDDDTAVCKMYNRKSRFKFNSPGSINSIECDPCNWILKTASQQPWTMHIVTLRDEITDGIWNEPYADTVFVRGASGISYVRVNDGALPPGLSIDNDGIISGTPTDTGSYYFGINYWNSGSGSADQEQYVIDISLPETCCTGPSRGNLDGSPDNLVTMSDLTYMIDHLYITLSPLTCIDEGNLDLSADNLVTMSDLTVMIDHLFITLEPLPPCIDYP